MKLEKSIFSILILSVLIILVITMLYTGFFVKSEEPLIEIPKNYYRCGKDLVPFRANITDCLEFPIKPNELAFEEVVLNPMAREVFILVNPNGSSELGMSAYEIFKTLSGLLIRSGVVYTEYTENQSNIPIMSIENSSLEMPIIWLRESQDRNLIEIFDNYIIVNAKTMYDMDAATCRLAIIAINDKFDCGVE